MEMILARFMNGEIVLLSLRRALQIAGLPLIVCEENF